MLPENTTRTVDFSDRSTAVLWGDGTQAMIVSTRAPGKARVSNTSITSDPKGWDKVVIPRWGHFSQHGSAVQTFAIKRTVQSYNSLASKYSEQNLYFISHQANLTMLKSVCRRCGIAEDRHHQPRVRVHGNAEIQIALAMDFRFGFVHHGVEGWVLAEPVGHRTNDERQER